MSKPTRLCSTKQLPRPRITDKALTIVKRYGVQVVSQLVAQHFSELAPRLAEGQYQATPMLKVSNDRPVLWVVTECLPDGLHTTIVAPSEHRP